MYFISTKLSLLMVFLIAPVTNPLAKWFKNEFAPMMPCKWKRVLYIASIIALTSFTDQPDFLLFEKINKLLKMSYKGQSYWIPKIVRNMIWKPILHDRIALGAKTLSVTRLDEYAITKEELDQICEYFLQRTPSWIVYAPHWYIKNDLRKCLTELFDRRFNTQLTAIAA